jgi:histone deacetylase complex regulatory component SIN3
MSLNQPNLYKCNVCDLAYEADLPLDNRSTSHMYDPTQTQKQFEQMNSPTKQLKSMQYKPTNSENKVFLGITPSQFNSIDSRMPPKFSAKYKKEEPASAFGSPKSILFIEGKMLFKMAREKLPFEKFNAFLKCIKSLNQGQIGKQDALEQSKNLFGSDNISLFNQFRQLLLRNEIK